LPQTAAAASAGAALSVPASWVGIVRALSEPPPHPTANTTRTAGKQLLANDIARMNPRCVDSQ
jgi:hypothetical protein